MSETSYNAELAILSAMEPEELRLTLAREALAGREHYMEFVTSAIDDTHSMEDEWMRLARLSIRYYNEDGAEADWVSFEGYTELVKSIQDYRVILREYMADITEEIRELNIECRKLEKIWETAQKLKPKKN